MSRAPVAVNVNYSCLEALSAARSGFVGCLSCSQGAGGRSRFNRGPSHKDTGHFTVSGVSGLALNFKGLFKKKRTLFKSPPPPLPLLRQASGKDLFSFSGVKINIYIPVLGVLIEIKRNSSLRVTQQFR